MSEHMVSVEEHIVCLRNVDRMQLFGKGTRRNRENTAVSAASGSANMRSESRTVDPCRTIWVDKDIRCTVQFETFDKFLWFGASTLWNAYELLRSFVIIMLEHVLFLCCLTPSRWTPQHSYGVWRSHHFVGAGFTHVFIWCLEMMIGIPMSLKGVWDDGQNFCESICDLWLQPPCVTLFQSQKGFAIYSYV